MSLVRADWLRLAVIGLVGGAVPFLLFFHGLQLAGKGAGGLTASFVYRTLFLFATVFGLVFLRERLAWKGFAGAALLLGGSYLLLSLGSPVWNDGTVYVLVATILWAAEYTLSKRTLARLPSATVALGRMGFGAVFLVGYLALTGQVGAPSAFSGVQWEWVAISAVLLAAFVGTWYAGLARVELSVATAVLVLGYPVTWVLSVALQGKALLPAPAAGAAAVVAGVSIVVGLRGMRASWQWLKQGLRVGTQAPG